MSFRLILALLGFLIVVGGPSIWLYYNIVNRKNLLASLLSQPKEKRFFWYRLRTSGFSVRASNRVKEIDYTSNGQYKNVSLKADFLISKKSRRYVGLFAPVYDEKEYLKHLLAYTSVFNTNGVIFYNEKERNISVWELN